MKTLKKIWIYLLWLDNKRIEYSIKSGSPGSLM